VLSLCDDLFARKSFRYWLIDFASPLLLQMLAKRWGPSLKAGNSEFKFAPAEGAGFFTARGWTMAEERIPADEARRLKREMPYAWAWRIVGSLMPAKKREQYRRLSGFALLGR
jgi:hypothetical protein